ncbi:phosphonate metabolism transcriptional regulator PhnF [Pseudoroseomonas rhizosphaerae]|uniref:Phosphonate metabolism transcriptional regulator PhnF n=1 Tax=Teichococcus rhizosphaerae TaxID=1335062 RepID=A0A2C7AIE1_9PROT|nr:phosphonate metabolism transcriptional regulator PhnF [Pseudoroseomonas rhizosphaerae]PHK97016.1 phosphonate metabolism transcriptional regulator PhnF [Pseudoroseomonas rhizosphaerae]
MTPPLTEAQEPPLARGDGVALWRQIAAVLEAAIGQGELPPGARLPTEAALAAQHGVNRHTARRALDSLAQRGLIRVEQGRGSFVAEDVVDYRLGPRTRFSELIRAQRREPEGRILWAREVPAEAAVAEALHLSPGAPVLAVERLGLADGRPVVLGLHHFPLPRFAGLAGSLAGGHGSITRALADCGVADYRRAWTRLTARMPTPEEAAHLQQARARPVMVSEALTADLAGRPIDHTLSRYAAGRVQIVIEDGAGAA